MKVLKWLDEHFEETLLVICLVLIACVCLIQVIIRNIPWIPSLQWAEEFCRFAWIWSVFLSLPYTIRKGTMLRVNVLLDLMPHVDEDTLLAELLRRKQTNLPASELLTGMLHNHLKAT